MRLHIILGCVAQVEAVFGVSNKQPNGIEVFREIGDRANEAEALKNLAELHQKLGEGDVAREYCEQALAVATELGIPLVAECQKLWEELEADS